MIPAAKRAQPLRASSGHTSLSAGYDSRLPTLDTRPRALFLAGRFPGSVNIAREELLRSEYDAGLHRLPEYSFGKFLEVSVSSAGHELRQRVLHADV